MYAFKASLCSLPGEIDELAYISTKECRFDGQEKSLVCTVSSDSTVRAWDVQEVSLRRGRGVTRWVLVRSFPFASYLTLLASLEVVGSPWYRREL